MCVKEAVNQPKNNRELKHPKFGGVIGLCSHLQGRQRQKGVALATEKVDITCWMTGVTSYSQPEDALTGAIAVKMPSSSRSLEKHASWPPGGISNLCSTMGGKASCYRYYF